MRDPSSLKQQFLKKWILGLQVCGSGKQNMSILERKKAIQLSADIALASTRDGRTCWSRALIANASKHDDNKILVQHMLATENERLKKASIGLVMDNKMVLRRVRQRQRAKDQARDGLSVARCLRHQTPLIVPPQEHFQIGYDFCGQKVQSKFGFEHEFEFDYKNIRACSQLHQAQTEQLWANHIDLIRIWVTLQRKDLII
ncbi:hypothetical protein D5086_032212 [Populus alba]|uniref:Uncharacterized protein n=1 Tax=Populus alba TaxID=43335 RepID=A0ACC4ALN1_POPAL